MLDCAEAHVGVRNLIQMYVPVLADQTLSIPCPPSGLTFHFGRKSMDFSLTFPIRHELPFNVPIMLPFPMYYSFES